MTILIEVLAFIGERNNRTEILVIYFKNMRMIVYSTPVFFQFMDLQRIFRSEVEISSETIDENTKFILEFF